MVQEAVLDEDDDEFEPLFTYQRVCRPPSEDDSDEDVTILNSKQCQSASKRKNFPSSMGKPKFSLDSRIHEDDLTKDIEDDDDWLPPPPKSAKVLLENKINEDPTVCELRREREELRRLAASTEAALRKLEEERRAQSAALQLQPQASAGGASEHCFVEKVREKVLISIQDKDGTCKAFKVFKDEKFDKLFVAYAESMGLLPPQLVFTFDGEKVSGTQTPKDLDMEDEDIVEVNVK